VSEPESPWKVPLAEVAVDHEHVSAATEAVSSGWWSMGPRVQEFERAFATFCGARHAFAVANGTAALHLALLAVGCGPDDEVVLPSLNFVAAANTIIHTGSTPVFCDIGRPPDLNLDPADLEAAISPRTKAIVVLHYGGFACDMSAVLDAAERHGVAVIEDAAHAPGSRSGSRLCGTIGQVGCFSFFSNKNLPVGEGGMVVTGDDDVAERVRLLRSHGMTTLTWDRHRGHATSYDVVVQGFNYRLDEMRAAIGLVQLRRLPGENAARARIASQYREELEGHGVHMAFTDRLGDPASAHHLAVALFRDERARERVRLHLLDRRIQTSIHYPPIHRFSAYREVAVRRALPQTEGVADRLLTLPLFGRMDGDQIDAVVTAVLEAAEK
jgi:dTDP-4-amino-4,6-dideoxygalactose transaminase